mmetsp:Transcript_82684/g.164994  ORF Transcript_82684/g.164994 Transcript_82684/m.164994 type:complete len:230 (-) Transcript_82684:1027-1716(-)
MSISSALLHEAGSHTIPLLTDTAGMCERSLADEGAAPCCKAASPPAHMLDASARPASDTEASPAVASTDKAGSHAVSCKGSLADEAAVCEVLTCERASSGCEAATAPPPSSASCGCTAGACKVLPCEPASPPSHVLDASARSASDTEASPAVASTDEAGSRAVSCEGSLADEAAVCEVLTCERASSGCEAARAPPASTFIASCGGVTHVQSSLRLKLKGGPARLWSAPA